jgi:dihydropteroate synthase-like protein
MTPAFIARRLPDARGADRIVLPGLCRGDLSPLQEKYGVPVDLGPEDLKDLPQYFGRGGKEPDLSNYDVKIFAEIVDAPQLPVADILARAERYRAQGANVIDLGCLPSTPFPHLEEVVRALKVTGFQVSVDSMQPEELLRGGHAGADYLLSLTEKTLWIADEVAATPVLIPARPGNLPSLYRAIEAMCKKGKAFIADPILDPIPFGLAESIVRYHKLRKKYPAIQVMMGVGNLTELTDADTTGINAVLFGIIAELKLNAVLTTSVSPHACNAVREADIARRVMFAAHEDRRLPRDYSSELLGLHDRRPFPYNEAEIVELAAQVKDPSFRIQVSEKGVHIYNRDGIFRDIDPFRLYPHLKVEDDASHAFYLGVELARAQIAWQLQKRYSQDEELAWGCNTTKPDARGRVAHREASLKEKKGRGGE